MEQLWEKLKVHWQLLVIGGLVLALGGVIWLMMGNSAEVEEENSLDDLLAAQMDVAREEEVESAESKPVEPELFMVDVKGEVHAPGVYELPADGRVKDAIAMAEGLTDEANELAINFAQKVEDQMVIYVPHMDDDSGLPENTTTGAGEASGATVININTASEQELMTLSGIGQAKAQQIIQYREENGLFDTPEDLMNVSGIGEKSFETLKVSIKVK
ncbi:helix-hairpin-helix domain-containing protein [Dolosigranulum pigrum]|uniref:helix-hairpin-helix domain-containing protein n=1 Tax=Dolosigranulum pigrum TaxID=29394 RepID=UPI001AD89156|nr:helix-hairpin-helix domain-containing protein [Dolosigranulum pigrum]QTJ47129.1 ComEA family DNA-binding protein [Dolosigranulum pigrum]QTJ60645.1 ComEA family DNA-binding protein [Dolosigranulum pigrum]